MSDRRKVLETIQAKLELELEVADGRDAAPLARELRLTLAELDSLPAAAGSAPADELKRRREDRRRQAAGE